MKKYLSIILSLILALAMVFSLVACGGDDSGSDDDSDESSKASSSQSSENVSSEKDDEPDSIVGKWEGTTTSPSVDMTVGAKAEFKADGTCILTLNADDMYEFRKQILLDEIAKNSGVEITFEQYLELAGKTEEEYREAYEANMGDDSYEGTYEFDGKTFILNEGECDFKFDGNKLSFTEKDGTSYEFERV